MSKTVRNVVPIRPTVKSPQSDLSIIIPSACYGKKIKHHGSYPLLELKNGKTLLEQQIQVLTGCYPEAEILVVIGHETEKILDKFNGKTNVRFIENEQYESRPTTSSIKLALINSLKSNILIVYGNIMFRTEHIIGLVGSASCITAEKKDVDDRENVGVNIVNNNVASFSYGFSNVWQQISYFTGKEKELLKKIIMNKENAALYFHEILNKIIDEDGKFNVVLRLNDDNFRSINSNKDVLAV